MDSTNSSSEMCLPKIEMDYESDREGKRDAKMNWTSDNTKMLIEALEKDCKELWDVKNPLNKDRWARQAKHEYLANVFGTTSEEISRKIHNLRTQFNNELRKIKRRQTGGGDVTVAGGSGWEYFDSLSFLLRSPYEPLEPIDGVNLAMPLTPAEKQKLYRERLKERDPEKYLSQKRKNADRTRAKRKKIAEYAPSEQENIRKQWRDSKKKSKEEPSSSLPETVPSARDPRVLKQEKNLNRRVIYKLKQENIELKIQQGQLRKSLNNFKKRMNRCMKEKNKLLDLIKEKDNLIHDLEEKLNSGDRIERNVDEMTPSAETNAYINQSKLAEFQADEEEKFGIAVRDSGALYASPSALSRHRTRLAEFQADEEEEFGIAARARTLVCSSPQNRHRPRVAASAPPPLPPSAHPMMWPEEAVPRLRPSINADECQIFGDFVASELRMLRSDESRKRLKRMIQKAILQIGEEEDVNMLAG